MSDKKIIAVLGATGAQGGGLVRSMLADKNGPFKPRALTRDVNSEKAKALAKDLARERFDLRGEDPSVAALPQDDIATRGRPGP